MFEPNSLSSTLILTSTDDDDPEPREAHRVTLQSTTTGVIIGSPSEAVIYIEANDDAAGVFSFQVKICELFFT